MLRPEDREFFFPLGFFFPWSGVSRQKSLDDRSIHDPKLNSSPPNKLSDGNVIFIGKVHCHSD